MNAKDRKPGYVEISSGHCEVVVFWAHIICVCARSCACVYVFLCVSKLLLNSVLLSCDLGRHTFLSDILILSGAPLDKCFLCLLL